MLCDSQQTNKKKQKMPWQMTSCFVEIFENLMLAHKKKDRYLFNSTEAFKNLAEDLFGKDSSGKEISNADFNNIVNTVHPELRVFQDVDLQSILKPYSLNTKWKELHSSPPKQPKQRVESSNPKRKKCRLR